MKPPCNHPDLFAAKQAKPRATRKPRPIAPDDPRIDQLLNALRGRGRVRREVLCAELHWHDRTLRQIVNAAGGHIISTSEEAGYELTLEALVEEVRHSANAKISQGRAIMERGIAELHVLFKAGRIQEAELDQHLRPEQPNGES